MTMSMSRAAAVLLLGALVGSCQDGPPTAPVNLSELLRELVLSDPIAGSAAAVAGNGAASVSPVTFVSLPDGTAKEAVSCSITNLRTSERVVTAVTNGGFGPLSIAAIAGDTIELRLLNSASAEIARLIKAVPIKRPPAVVRTTPPRGKTDVPLNIRMEVVFSEPIDPASIRSGAIRLMHGPTRIPGRAEPADGANLGAVFVPSAPLKGSAAYMLEITREIRDFDGDALAEAMTVPFTTAPAAPSLTLRPETLRVASDDDWPLGGWLVAEVRDAEGEEVFGVSVGWSTSNPDILQLSSGPPSSLTGRANAGVSGSGAAGVADVIARSAFGTDTMTVIVEPVRFVDVSVIENGASKCFVTDVGRIYCHGDNQFGQLGLGIADHAPQFSVSVATNESFAAVSGGVWHACAITIGGAAYCWGHNLGGQVGRTESLAEPTPVLVSSELSFSQISVGPLHSCGLAVSGGTYCWGVQWSSLSLQLARAGPVATIPIRVPGEMAFRQVSAGGTHSCGIDGDGVAWCWGLNAAGQLGNGTFEPSGVPARVSGDLRFAWIDAGPASTCGVTTDGAAYCWGSEDSGGGYTSTLPETNVPARVPIPSGVSLTAVDVGNGPTCALANDGSAWCWGFTWHTDLTDTAVPPTKVPGDLRFTSLSAGFDVCGVSTDSIVYCWQAVAGTPYRVPGQRYQ